MRTLRPRLSAKLRDIENVVESDSMFSPEAAFWVDGKEIAHFDADDTIDVRLTRALIGELRTDLKTDERVRLRPNTSDWIEVRFSSEEDVEFVRRLVARAAAAHRPPTGSTPNPPPTGSDLERRRRFH